jgi:enolase-phosphatase E1
MSADLEPQGLPPVKVIVLDIEGTTAPISFVKDRLFPFARQRLPEFVRSQLSPEEQDRLFENMGTPPGDVEAAVRQLLAWSDADQKVSALKTVQGQIWRAGYESGELLAPLYADVLPALKQWRLQGIALAVYSSGSVAAQKLFYGHTDAGDLRGLFSHFFDTSVGAKLQPASYAAIAATLGFAAGETLFVSDLAGEVEAARQAGWHALHITRDDQAQEHTEPAPGRITRLSDIVEGMPVPARSPR